MAEFKQKIPKESVNYSRENPLKDLAGMVIGLFVVLAVSFYFFDFFAGFATKHISFKQEKSWFGSINSRITKKFIGSGATKKTAAEEVLLSLMEKLWLPFDSEDDSIKFDIQLIQEKQLNAFTGLGGQFYFTKGLINSSDSLNGLTFVACHELGHFFYRHVLRATGRKLLMGLMLNIVGLGGAGEGVVGVGSEVVSLKFSRDAEVEADNFALDCLQKFFGHVAGFDEFFKNTLKTDLGAASFLSSHPKTQTRIEELKIYAIKEGYSLEGELTPLPDSLREKNKEIPQSDDNNDTDNSN